MDNLVTLFCFAALIIGVIIAFLIISRLGNRGTTTTPMPPGRLGNETPRYDDPNVSSGGSFGGVAPSSQASNPPSTSHNRGISLGGDAPRHDDPNVKSGGSFGG